MGRKCFGKVVHFILTLWLAELMSLCICSCEWKNLLVPADYNKFETPGERENETTYIYIDVYIMDIDHINEESMDYSMQFYMSERWKDERLNFSYIQSHIGKVVPEDWVKDLWLPDTIFENSKAGWIYSLSVPNTIVKISTFGYLYRFTRYNMVMSCRMFLQKYPMDTQHCQLIIASLAYYDDLVNFRWLHERPEGTEGNHDLSHSDITPLKYHLANVSCGFVVTMWQGGEYTALHANLAFQRYLSSHIVNVYIPTGIIVTLSFLTFWLDVSAVPARVALGLTSLLTLSTQASQARNDLPPINYLTALDVWLFTCMMLVFLSLLEYAVVYHSKNVKIRNQKAANAAKCTESKNWEKPSARVFSSRNQSEKEEIKKEVRSDPAEDSPANEFEEDGQFVDRVCRIVFPAAFALFQVVYWIGYLSIK